MATARGHSDRLSADAHRLRLLQTSAMFDANRKCEWRTDSAYQNTTDDMAQALKYFHESQAPGVQPNIFLYNDFKDPQGMWTGIVPQREARYRSVVNYIPCRCSHRRLLPRR